MKKISAAILGAAFLSFVGFSVAGALTVDYNQGGVSTDVGGGAGTGVVIPNINLNPNAGGNVNSTGSVNTPNVGGIVNTGTGSVSAITPKISPNTDANGNLSLLLDRAGNLISGAGFLPLGTVNGLLQAVPGLGTGASSSGSAGSQGGPIVVYQSDAAAASNNPYPTKQLATSNGNGTVVYYYVASNPNGVQSEENLQSYATYTVASDENMQKAAIDQNGIDITYDQPANFLGFIPTHVPVDVHIDNDGQTSLDYPWYSFLLDTNAEALQSGIQAKVDEVLDQSVNVPPQTGGAVSGNISGAGSNVGVGGTGNGGTSGGNVSGGGTVSGVGNVTNDVLPNNNVGGDVGGTTGEVSTDLENASPQTKAQVLGGVQDVLEANASSSN